MIRKRVEWDLGITCTFSTSFEHILDSGTRVLQKIPACLAFEYWLGHKAHTRL
jgi:hypothetical protein